MESSPSAPGFTLIEILVSVTLLLLLSGLFMANYNSFNTTQTVKQAKSDLITNLLAVRTMATASIKPCGAPDTLVGYVVTFLASSYTAQASCQTAGAVGEIKRYYLPAGVMFSPPPVPLTFYTIDGGASVNQTISLVNNGVSMHVYVFSSGVVSATP